MTQVASKPVDILYRVTLKTSGIIVYVVLSSDGVTRYNVTVVRGKVNSCSCPSYKPCRHMAAVEAREREQARASEVLAVLARKNEETEREAMTCIVCGYRQTYHEDAICGWCRC